MKTNYQLNGERLLKAQVRRGRKNVVLEKNNELEDFYNYRPYLEAYSYRLCQQ